MSTYGEGISKHLLGVEERVLDVRRVALPHEALHHQLELVPVHRAGAATAASTAASTAAVPAPPTHATTPTTSTHAAHAVHATHTTHAHA